MRFGRGSQGLPQAGIHNVHGTKLVQPPRVG